ncbi:MAG: hypothetical protein LBC78_01230 [Oscillospiraceae bacterium]|jgi:D-alanyl-D-alanine carboxypeptidase (penicillin-binding protein 5/6)|nr:hypothetical protein [Oscillospiraceae bacterium]
MRKAKILAAFLTAAILMSHAAFSPPVLAAPAPPQIAADSAFLAEVTTGTNLLTQGADAAAEPGALTKLMTLLLCAEYFEKGAIQITSRITAQDSAVSGMLTPSPVKITPGETLTFRDLLMCALLGGSDEACNILAARLSGSVPAFIELMNVRAEELLLSGTRFVNTHGQSAEGQTTTARDIFLIMREGINYPLFTEILGTIDHIVPNTSVSPARPLTNKNAIMLPNSELYDEFTVAGLTSGGSSAQYSSKDGLETIAVVFGAGDGGAAIGQAKATLAFGYEHYRWVTPLTEGMAITALPLAYGVGTDAVLAVPEREVRLLLSSDITDDMLERTLRVFSQETGEVLRAPIRRGDALGEISFSVNGRELARVRLISGETIGMERTKFFIDKLRSTLSRGIGLGIFLCFFGILTLYFSIVIRYNVKRRRKRRELEPIRRRLIEERRAMAAESLTAPFDYFTEDGPSAEDASAPPYEACAGDDSQERASQEEDEEDEEQAEEDEYGGDDEYEGGALDE